MSLIGTGRSTLFWAHECKVSGSAALSGGILLFLGLFLRIEGQDGTSSSLFFRPLMAQELLRLMSTLHRSQTV